MVKEFTIFDEIIENLERKQVALQEGIKKLEEKNKKLADTITNNERLLASSTFPWNEKAETEADIRYDREQIAGNDRAIQQYKDELQQVNTQIQEHKKLQNPGK